MPPVRLLDHEVLAGQPAQPQHLGDLRVAQPVALHRAYLIGQGAVSHLDSMGHLRFPRLDGFDLVGHGSGYFPARTRGSAGGMGFSSAQRTPLSSSR